ncbi:hypothetical protein DSM25558_2968 [Agrobacterium sp. DSM 25558]|nr:hypothetical protein DSM25558_2968 [Agrobacterium sp. DSM 25558]
MDPTKSRRWDLGLRPPYPLVPDARPSCRSLRRYGERVPVRTGSSLKPLSRPSPANFKHAISVEAGGGASNQGSLGLEPQFNTFEFCNIAVRNRHRTQKRGRETAVAAAKRQGVEVAVFLGSAIPEMVLQRGNFRNNELGSGLLVLDSPVTVQNYRGGRADVLRHQVMPRSGENG